MIEVVVPLGAPGAGKSTIGHALERHGLRWREWERFILDRWGSRDAFVANKKELLPLLHQEILDWIAADSSAAVIETTGLSDAPLLAQLEETRATLVVRLDVGEDEALRRIDQRTPGRHLSDEIGLNRRVWMAYQRDVVPHARVDFVFNTGTQPVEAIVAAILTAMKQ